MTIQKLFCKIVPWVCVLIPGAYPDYGIERESKIRVYRKRPFRGGIGSAREGGGNLS